MADFFKSIGKGFESAADSTKRGTKKLLVNQKISYRKTLITKRKQIFGQRAFTCFESKDEAGMDRHFREAQADIKELEAQIGRLQEVVATLDSGTDVDTSNLEKENPIPYALTKAGKEAEAAASAST
eukprot:g53800.t1